MIESIRLFRKIGDVSAFCKVCKIFAKTSISSKDIDSAKWQADLQKIEAERIHIVEKKYQEKPDNPGISR